MKIFRITNYRLIITHTSFIVDKAEEHKYITGGEKQHCLYIIETCQLNRPAVCRDAEACGRDL